jgi:glycosyltransferase involved in cell wall biosynthesis
MKIAIVYQFWPHYRQAFLEALARDSRMQVTLLGDDRDRRKGAPIPTAEIPEGIEFICTRTRYFRGIMFQSGLISLALRKWDAIIYLGDPQYPSTLVSSLLARFLGQRVIFWSIGWMKEPESSPKERYRTWFYKRANALLLYGCFARKIAIRQGFKPENVYVIFNSRDISTDIEIGERYLESRGNIDANEKPVWLFSGRLMARKRLDLLFNAIAALRSEGIHSRAVIVGTGPERPSLEELQKNLGIDVEFLGEVYRPEKLVPLFINSTAVVSPGQVGLLVTQSLAAGVRVVINDDPTEQGPEAEVVRNLNQGIRFKANDLSSLVEAMKAIIQGPTPPRKDIIESVRLFRPEHQVEVLMSAVSGTPTESPCEN